MDPVTHALVGATATQSIADRKSLRWAGLIGFGSALMPDLDVFLGHSADPLLNLELHRQFTHSLLFTPFGALLATALFWWLVRHKLSLKQTYLYSLVGYGSGGIVDTFTSYGVHLFWPLEVNRISLDVIAVFDPLFSLGIAILVGLAFYHRKQQWSFYALGWIGLYLLFGFYQQQRTFREAQHIADQQNYTVEQIIAKPTIANNILWSARFVTADSVHTAGIRLLPFGKATIYEGESAPLLEWEQIFAEYKNTTLFKDLHRFAILSSGVLIEHPEYENVIGDGRYAMLPTSVKPIWGITADTTRPNQHVDFLPYRDANKQVRQDFKNMLLGNYQN